MTKRSWGAIIVLSVLWGGAYLTAKIAVDEISVVWIVAIRFLLAGFALFILLRASNAPIPMGQDLWASFATMGVCNSLLPGLLVTWAQQSVPSGFASIVVACTPLFALALDVWVTHEQKFELRYLFGTLVAIGGLSLVVGAELPHANRDTLLAVLACLGAAASYGCANVYGRSFRERQIEPKTVAFGQIAATAVLSVPIALIASPLTGTEVWPSLSATLAVLGLALVSTAGGYVLFFRILASSAAKSVSFVTLLIPVSATVLGALVLGERLQSIQFVGLITIILGLFMVNDAQQPATRPVTDAT